MKNLFIRYITIIIFFCLTVRYAVAFPVDIVNDKNNVLTSIEKIRLADSYYFNLHDLITYFNLLYLWEPVAGILELEDSVHKLKIRLNEKTGLLNGKLIYLSAPPVYNQSRVMLPEQVLGFFTNAVEVDATSDRQILKKIPASAQNADPITETILKYNRFKQPPAGAAETRTQQLKTIIIDPGHGGRDAGAVGPGKTNEKDISLAIAFQLKEAIEKYVPGVRALLTRTGDSFESLEDRTVFANRNKGDLFISLHCNAGSRTASGFEIYFFSLNESDETERTVRLMENAAVREQSQKNSIVDFITTDLAQLNYIRESVACAHMIQENLRYKLQLPDRGVKKARFFVLKDVFMPAVLVEVGFISNRSEERLLRRDIFRKRIAVGIANAVSAFKKSLEK